MTDEDVVRAFLHHVARQKDPHDRCLRIGWADYAGVFVNRALSGDEVEAFVVSFIRERDPTRTMEEALYRALKRVQEERDRADAAKPRAPGGAGA